MNMVMYKIPKLNIDKTIILHPHAYRNIAHAYLCSAEALAKQFGFNVRLGMINVAINPSPENERRYDILLNPGPFWYLLGHSLELYLKGYLKYENIDYKTRGKGGHLLAGLMKKCNGIEFTNLQKIAIEMFDQLNIGDGNEYTYLLRYIAPGKIALPNVQTTIDLLYMMDKILLSKKFEQ